MSDILARGTELAILGMGTVFVFLTLLVLATMAMSAIIGRLSPPEVPETAIASASADARMLAAVAAAVRRYREDHVDRNASSS